jgi:hypothetical protein
MNTQTYIARITHPKTLAGRLRTACTTSLLPLLLLFALPAAVQAQFNIIITNGTVTITGCTGLGAVTIPSTINGLPVTRIGDSAFAFCPLSSVTIPNSVTNIGDHAFAECTSLNAIAVDTLNPAYSSFNGALLDKNQTTLIQCPANKVGSYTIPSSVTTIASWAFIYCSRLTRVIIPDSVTSIGENAFCACTGLSTVAIPNGVTAIPDDVFYDCSGLTSATLGGRVTSIGMQAFTACTSLTNITLPNGLTFIGNEAFQGCGHLTGIALPSSVASIGDWAFGGTSLTNVTIPTAVAAIGPGAFAGCTSLAAITVDALNASFSSVGGVLFDKDQTTLLQYPAGKAGGYYTVPGTVTSIGSGAFAFCTWLNTITNPASVINVASDAFQCSSRLTAVYFLGNAPSGADSNTFSVFAYSSG